MALAVRSRPARQRQIASWGWLDSFKRPLDGMDAFYGAPGQAPWGEARAPLPRVRYKHQRRQGFIDTFEPTLIAQDQFYGDPGQSAWSEGMPRLPLRKPLRHRRQFAIYSGEPLLLEGMDEVPGRQSLEPLPLERPPWHWRQDYQYHGEPLPLEGQDTFYGDAGQAPTFAQSPKYRSTRRLLQDWNPPSISVTTLGEAEGMPEGLRTFGMTGPRLVRPPLLQAFMWPAPVNGVLEGADEVPGKQWVQPRAAVRPPLFQEFTFSFPLVLEGADEVPGKQWVHPRAAVRPPLFQEFVFSFPRVLEGADEVPGRQSADPTPRVRPDWHLRQSFAFSGEPLILEGTDEVPGVVWVKPRSAVRPPLLQEFVASFPLPLVGADQFYGEDGQAPVFDIGVLYRPRRSLLPQWEQVGTPNLLEPSADLPEGRPMWEPLPRTRRPVPQDFLWQARVNGVLLGADDVPGNIWAEPLPRTRPPVPQFFLWPAPVNGVLLGVDTVPGEQWMEPRARVRRRVRPQHEHLPRHLWTLADAMVTGQQQLSYGHPAYYHPRQFVVWRIAQEAVTGIGTIYQTVIGVVSGPYPPVLIRGPRWRGNIHAEKERDARYGYERRLFGGVWGGVTRGSRAGPSAPGSAPG